MVKVRGRGKAPAFGLDACNFTETDRNEPRPIGLADRRAEEQLESCVYFIECGEYVRIGVATQRPGRSSVKVHMPPDGKIVAAIPHAGDVVRRQVGDMFQACRVNGNWFSRCPELDALIAAHAVDD